MEDSSGKLIEHWRSLNLLIAPGNTEEKVREFESRNGVMLPLDFREYLLSVNGMVQVGGQDCDPNGFAFWPIARVKSVRKEYAEHSTPLPEVQDPDAYFVFVDYLQWCWAYAIRVGAGPSEGGQIIHVGTIRSKVVAPSFTEFVDLYLRDARELYV
ncbi:MAG TPA: SMI1/KNR4 family protein [Terriglobales bacterium]|jgi:hypothetical protein|nr:SMI1/KNR4 family protein [Terriglobales bacterium]